MTFSAVKGQIGCGAGAPAGPDGGDCAGGNTNIHSAGAISGIIHHQRTQFLVGVFLGPGLPAHAPAILDFSTAATGDSFAEVAPALGQTFFIGDGVTPSGVHHKFTIPAGATRCFLGFADAYGFQGDPGEYGDNTGGVSATLSQSK